MSTTNTEVLSDRVGEAAPTPTAAPALPAPPINRVMPEVWTLDDLETQIEPYLPRSIFAWAAKGSERFIPGRTNQEAFEDWAFKTRVMVDTTHTNTATEVLGKKFDAPFGICPMGGIPAVGGKDADLKIGLAATSENIPFMLSGGAGTTYEEAHQKAPNTWAQFYAAGSREVMVGMMDRLLESGHDVLVVTVDINVLASAVHSQRLGWSLPIRFTNKLLWDGITHPEWVAKVALRGFMPDGPRIENMHPEIRPKMFSFKPLPQAGGRAATWEDLAYIRKRWPGKLVIKGIINPADARRALDIGVDAVMVSNHGARQVDYALASLRALPAVVAEVKGQAPVFIDSGFRCGTHVMMALALGASFVFIGRPFLFAVGLGGEAGVVQAIRVLKTELHRNLALIGCPDINDLDRDFLTPARPALQ